MEEDSSQNIYFPDNFLEEILFNANNTASIIESIHQHFIKNRGSIRKELGDLSFLQKFPPLNKTIKFKTIAIGCHARDHLTSKCTRFNYEIQSKSKKNG